MGVGDGTAHSPCVEVRGQLEWVLSLPSVGSRDQTQVSRLAQQCLYPLSHPPALNYNFFLFFLFETRSQYIALGIWISLYRPSWPQTHSSLLASTSWVLGLKTYATIPGTSFVRPLLFIIFNNVYVCMPMWLFVHMYMNAGSHEGQRCEMWEPLEQEWQVWEPADMVSRAWTQGPLEEQCVLFTSGTFLQPPVNLCNKINL